MIILVIIYLPLFIVILISFNNSTNRGNINLVFGVPDNNISAYQWLADDQGFVNGLINSIIIGIIATPISVVIAVLTSFAIWNNKKIYTKIALGISSASITIPEIITGLSLIILFASTWLSFDHSLGLFTIIVSHIAIATPYAFVTIFPRMQKMNFNLILASEDLGYSKFATFFKITVPYLLPAILSASLIAFAMSFDDFIVTNLVRGSTQTISSELYLMRKGVKAWAVAFGAIIIFLTIIITIIFSFKKWLTERTKHRETIIKRQQKLTKISVFKKVQSTNNSKSFSTKLNG